MVVLGAPEPLDYVFFVGRRDANIMAPENVTVTGLRCPLISVNGEAEPGWAAWLEQNSDDSEPLPPLPPERYGLTVEYRPETADRGDGQAGKRDTTFKARVYNNEPFPVPLSEVSLAYWFHGGNLFCGGGGGADDCSEEKTRPPWAGHPVYSQIHAGELDQCGVQPTGDLSGAVWAAPVSLFNVPCSGTGRESPLVAAAANVTWAPGHLDRAEDARLVLNISFNGSTAWLAPAGWPPKQRLQPEGTTMAGLGEEEAEDGNGGEGGLAARDTYEGVFNMSSGDLLSYVEVEASIQTGQTLGIVLNMSEELDYSYSPQNRWWFNERLTGYVDGELAWGEEPGFTNGTSDMSTMPECPSPAEMKASNITDLLQGKYLGCNLVANYCCLNESSDGTLISMLAMNHGSRPDDGGAASETDLNRTIEIADGNTLKVSWWAFLLLGIGILVIGAGAGIMIFKRVLRRRAEPRGVRAGSSGKLGGRSGFFDNSPHGSNGPIRAKGRSQRVRGSSSLTSSLEVELQTSPRPPAGKGGSTGTPPSILRVDIPGTDTTGTTAKAWVGNNPASPSVVLAELGLDSPNPEEFLASWLERIGANVLPPSPTPALVTPPESGVSTPPSFLDVDTHKIQLLKQIGSGAHGSVYEAIWVDHGNLRVAVKVLNEVSFVGGERASESKLATLKTEVCLLSRLEHPNIVKLLGACLAPPRICLVEELLEKSLGDLIAERRGAGLDYREILQVGNQVAAALAYLHPTVVHRDLKPANVLVDRNGRYKVADFGIARCKSSTYLVTTEGTGTPAYMAPELFGQEKACEKVDVYSLGMVLWQCLTGKTPWGHLTVPFQVVMLVGIEQKRPDLPADCPPPLRSLIEKCWDGDPRRRPSCAEIEKRTRLLLEQGKW